MNPTLSGPLGRRAVIKGGTVAAVAGAAVAATVAPSDAATNRYFKHGVASGDPLPTAVVLWTRITPTTSSRPGSGVGPQVRVRWQVARDAAFTRIVATGTQVTGPLRDHTVKVDARGLAAATTYYYRFTYRGAHSRHGRARTAPAAGSSVNNLRLGVVSCANLQAGWFSAYRHLADRNDLHAILHLGDYLYEYAPGQYGNGQGDVDIRRHVPAREMVTLADYRQRHAQYKQDEDLQRLHARYAFITTWDDHEVANDTWKDGAENHTDATEGSFAARRARAKKAYDEWMPIRLEGTAAIGDGTRLYRRLAFGQLAELSMLDLRTYRDQAVTAGPDVSNPDRTITGRAQLDWLKTSLDTDRAQWKLVGNPVMIAPVNFGALPRDLVDPIADLTGLPRDGVPYNTDQWDGYTDDRREVIEHLRDQGVRDTVFLTGDIHSGWASDLPADAGTYLLTGDSAGVEFVCTSVTSNNLKDITGTPPRSSSIAVEEAIKTANPHIKYLNFDDHGYSVLDLTPARAQMDWYVIGDRADRKAGAKWTTSFETRAGDNRIRSVAKPVNA